MASLSDGKMYNKVTGPPPSLIPGIADRALQNLKQESGSVYTVDELERAIFDELKPYSGTVINKAEMDEVKQAMFPVSAGVVPGTEVRKVETTEAIMRALESRAKNALETINSLEQKFNPNNPYDTIVSNLPFAPTAIENMLMSADKKAYEQAKRDFLIPILRRQSGAVINTDEIDYFDRTYFPQPGDSEATIRMKKIARDSLVDGFTKSPQDKAVKEEDKGIGSMKSMRSMRGMMYGGPVMAYAQGGAVQMQEGGEMDPSEFPRMDGDINGPGTETSDDIPAMLSDGEFVMTGRAVRGAGSYDMAMDPKGIISLIPSFEEDRERGMDLMYKMMDAFAANAESVK